MFNMLMPLDPTLLALVRTIPTEFRASIEIVHIPSIVGRDLGDVYNEYPNLSYSEHTVLRGLLKKELIVHLKTILLIYGHDDLYDLEPIMNTPEYSEWIKNWNKQSLSKMETVAGKDVFKIVTNA